MAALFGLLTIIIISIVLVRIGATALELTGISPDVANFQAKSAFYGVGFTTSESESIVSHAFRRRIVGVLILVGSVGFTSSVATLILAFIGQSGPAVFTRILVLLAGLLAIFLFARSKYIHRIMRRIFTRALEKNPNLQIYDYEQILGLSKGYTIAKINVKDVSWLSGKKLNELKLNLEGVLVLSIYRVIDKKELFLGAPGAETEIHSGDILVCYAREEEIQSLSKRCKDCDGDADHERCVRNEQNHKKILELTGGFE